MSRQKNPSESDPYTGLSPQVRQIINEIEMEVHEAYDESIRAMKAEIYRLRGGSDLERFRAAFESQGSIISEETSMIIRISSGIGGTKEGQLMFLFKKGKFNGLAWND